MRHAEPEHNHLAHVIAVGRQGQSLAEVRRAEPHGNFLVLIIRLIHPCTVAAPSRIDPEDDAKVASHHVRPIKRQLTEGQGVTSEIELARHRPEGAYFPTLYHLTDDAVQVGKLISLRVNA